MDNYVIKRMIKTGPGRIPTELSKIREIFQKNMNPVINLKDANVKRLTFTLLCYRFNNFILFCQIPNNYPLKPTKWSHNRQAKTSSSNMAKGFAAKLNDVMAMISNKSFLCTQIKVLLKHLKESPVIANEHFDKISKVAALSNFDILCNEISEAEDLILAQQLGSLDIKVPATLPPQYKARSSSEVLGHQIPMGSMALMLELRKHIYVSSEYRNGLYSVEVDENVFSWNVKYHMIAMDPDSLLYQDFKRYWSISGKDYILFQFMFSTSFPIDPPFVRVVEPLFVVADGVGFVKNGGIICAEVLSTQGWSEEFRIENLIIQIGAMLCMGGARLDFKNLNTDLFTEEKAREGMKVLKEEWHSDWFKKPSFSRHSTK